MADKTKNKPVEAEALNTNESLYDRAEKARAEYVRAVKLPIEYLRAFENHPYKVTDNEEMQKLIESIRERGILTPLMVRKISGTEYEVISGHRRLYAAKELGIETVPTVIYELSYEEAVIAMVDSNLQREHILPSEKAKAYQMKMEAMKRTAGRPSKNSCQVGTNSRTDEIIAEKATDSARQIHRYIRLNNLIPELLELVDEEKIALTPAVELSYLTDEEQYSLLGTIEEEDKTPSLSQAVRFKKLSQAGELTDEQIESIMLEEKANQKPMFKVPMERLQQIAPKIKDKEFENFVLKACEYYYRHLMRSRDRDAR